MVKDIESITWKESRITAQQIRTTSNLMLSWMKEHPWQYDCDYLDEIARRFEEDLDLQMMAALAVDEAFELSRRTPDDFQKIIERAALLIPRLVESGKKGI